MLFWLLSVFSYSSKAILVETNISKAKKEILFHFIFIYVNHISGEGIYVFVLHNVTCRLSIVKVRKRRKDFVQLVMKL
jgi:hypothetical protein